MLKVSVKFCRKTCFITPIRLKKTEHWKNKEKNSKAVNAALKHFDDFYPKVYGDKVYDEIRDALLESPHYMAIVNNYGDSDLTKTNFEVSGALNLRKLYALQSEVLNELQKKQKRNEHFENIRKLDAKTNFDANLNQVPVKSIDYSDLSLKKSLEKSEIDLSRIVDLKNGIGGERLYDFIPASKIRTQDTNWVTESEHYDYYAEKEKVDFPVKIERELNLNFPEVLDVYFYNEYSKMIFKDPQNNSSTGVLNYLLLNGGSVLPVLALDIAPNDCVLDMCAAPGAKSYIILQTLKPKLLVCNDNSSSRVDRIYSLMKEYFYDFNEKWIQTGKVFVTENDARAINDIDIYDKILVDVPCTTDRQSVQVNDNNIFKSTRVRERLSIPELQSDILFHALKLVKIGGNVVYSTCSLSPIQNDGVVHMAMKRIWEETSYKLVIKDLTPALKPLKNIYRIADKKILRYGNVIYPISTQNYGPTYLCKITKLQ